jgi:hypothetical protein
MSKGRGFLERSSRGSTRAILIAVIAVIVAAAVAVPLIVTRGRGHAPASPTATAAPAAPLPTCDPSGCAVVSLSRTLPRVTIFYGASCSGVNGPWFFNIVEPGGNDELLPSYALRWSFASGATAALPDGRIVIPATSSTHVTVTLTNGMLSLAGTKKPNTTVAATGTLTVRLSGPASAPVLTFTETGLLKSEQALGLVSPLYADGKSLIVPVKTVKKMVGC